jgi:hypothetical protein
MAFPTILSGGFPANLAREAKSPIASMPIRGFVDARNEVGVGNFGKWIKIPHRSD